MRVTAITVLCCAGAFLGGCTSQVTITSRPAGARVWIDGKASGRTPLKARVKWTAAKRNRITLDHPECHRFSTALRRKACAANILSDLVLLGGIGLALLPVNSVGPVTKQHFVLARRPDRVATASADGRAGSADSLSRIVTEQVTELVEMGLLADAAGVLETAMTVAAGPDRTALEAVRAELTRSAPR